MACGAKLALHPVGGRFERSGVRNVAFPEPPHELREIASQSVAHRDLAWIERWKRSLERVTRHTDHEPPGDRRHPRQERREDARSELCGERPASEIRYFVHREAFDTWADAALDACHA